jgi:hypothetical protein
LYERSDSPECDVVGVPLAISFCGFVDEIEFFEEAGEEANVDEVDVEVDVDDDVLAVVAVVVE